MIYSYLGYTPQQIASAYQTYYLALIENEVGKDIRAIAEYSLLDGRHGITKRIATAKTAEKMHASIQLGAELFGHILPLATHFALRDTQCHQAFHVIRKVNGFKLKNAAVRPPLPGVRAEQNKYVEEHAEDEIIHNDLRARNVQKYRIEIAFQNILLFRKNAHQTTVRPKAADKKAAACVKSILTVLKKEPSLELSRNPQIKSDRTKAVVTLHDASQEVLKRLQIQAAHLGVKSYRIQFTPTF